MDTGLQGVTLRVTTWLRNRNCSLAANELKIAAGACAVCGVAQREDLDSIELGNEKVVMGRTGAARCS